MRWFIGHLVGDWLMQNDWMAANKKKSTWACFVHVDFYTLFVWGISGWPTWTAPLIFLPHFLIDRTTFVAWWMEMSGREGFMKEPYGPWSLIAIDQVFHVLCLYAVDGLVRTGAWTWIMFPCAVCLFAAYVAIAKDGW